MRQLLQNLLGNALKFHQENVPPLVKVYALPPERDGTRAGGGEQEPERERIVVEDHGIGFDEKYRDRIFGVFQRLHHRAEYEGSGIGLAVCRRIVERHGGSIDVTSQVGQGTTFTVALPLRQTKPG
jgi:signal transduction histidine kinase